MPRPRSNIDRRILHAARRRFLAAGVDGASLRRIAADARTSIGMIYYYFPTKDELFLAVVEEVYGALMGELEAVLARDLPLEERLRLLGGRIAALSEAQLDVVRLVVREGVGSSKRRERLFERFARGHLGLVLGAIMGGLAKGEVDARHHPIVATMATLAVTVVPQLMRRFAAGSALFAELPSGDALAAALQDVLFRGIAKQEETRPRGKTTRKPRTPAKKQAHTPPHRAPRRKTRTPSN
ncbi:MAG: TetR/AcrR family transcriptional regulator [Myxococcales bacterium]|nr:TetR/AcrR family transcriptional regulator [Myxococcales bacterium]